MLVLELGGYRRLDVAPRQAACQHRQRIVQIDHGVNSAMEKIYRLHHKSLRNQLSVKRFLRDLVHAIYEKS